MIPCLYASMETKFDNNGIGKMADAHSCVVTEKRNGSFELEMVYPADGIHAENLEEGNIILAKPSDTGRPQPFRIYKIATPIDGKLTVKARHISYQLNFITVSPFATTGCTGALAALESHAASECPFGVWTDISSSASFRLSVPSSFRNCLGGIDGSVLDTFGGEYEWDRYTVKLHHHRGADHGVHIVYGKNLIDFKMEKNIESVITGVHPYWQNSETGEVTELPEKVVLVEQRSVPYQKITVLDCTSGFQDKPTDEMLRSFAQDYLKNTSLTEPQVDIDIDFIQLWNTPDYEDVVEAEQVSLCDTVHVFISKLGIEVSSKVTETQYDCLLERYDGITLSNSTVSSRNSSLTTALSNIRNTANEAYNTALRVETSMGEQIGGISVSMVYDGTLLAGLFGLHYQNVTEVNGDTVRYVRVSTDNDEQTSSYELQKNYYTEYITGHPGWELVGIYADEGISGTSIAHRKGMLQMIEDCKAGKIDLIMTKSIARFARNIVDCLSVIDLLKNLEPPVGVQFEADNIYTLDNNGRMILTILASVAEEESHSKSVIMNWSIERRFRKGLFLTPELLGYDRDEDGDLIVNEDEAETVKAIYYLYLNGVSFSDIAELLKAYKRKTKQGSYEWSASTLAEIVANERHCGDIRAWKTFTPNFLTHKAKKNNGERTQFRRKNHHEAIVSRTVYEAANFLRASRAYAKKARPLPVLSVVDNGILRGYVPLDKDWTGFSTDEYQKASESVMSELEDTRQIEYKAGLDMSGYEVVRSQYFSTTQNPAMTIADGKLCFNTACLKKFENVEYVELLLNSVNRCIAVRPCDGNNPNAIHWGKLREGRWCALSKSCRGLAKTLFDIMDWDQDLKYRFRGDFIENDDQKVMLFQLDEPEMVKTENIVLPPKEAETDDRAEIAGRTVKQIINILPPEWEDTFGRPITSIGEINLLEQSHYAADWDVLRPAKELAEYSTLTSEDLEELLHEAEKIIEGWPIPDEHGAGESADNGDGESAGVGTECGADVGAGTEENGDRADL